MPRLLGQVRQMPGPDPVWAHANRQIVARGPALDGRAGVIAATVFRAG
jgi:hypothetical protein